MFSRPFWFLTAFLILALKPLSGAEGWAQLKVGMSVDEAMEALGDPLMKTSGRGFELWVYDNHAEVLFYGGPLVGWTTPSKGKAKGHAVDVWQRKPGTSETPLFILPRPTSQRNGIDRRPVGAAGAAEESFGSPLYRVSK